MAAEQVFSHATTATRDYVARPHLFSHSDVCLSFRMGGMALLVAPSQLQLDLRFLGLVVTGWKISLWNGSGNQFSTVRAMNTFS